VLAVEVEDGSNVGMIQLGERQGFFAEAPARRLVGKRSYRQDPESHVAFEMLIVGAMEFAHAARADLL
jgi:hypothetical protein